MCNIFSNISFIMLSIFLSGCIERNSTQAQGDKPTQTKKKPELSMGLYIENSGSMHAYDGPTNNGQFRDVVANVFNTFERVDGVKIPSINYVNNSIQHFNGDFGSLINSNIFNSTDKRELATTDFALIFNKIVEKTNENTVSVLFSDLIYSDPKNAVSSADDLLSRVENMTANAFNRSSSGLSLIIIKFEGYFNGGYYTYNSPRGSKAYKGKRPFYMVVVAKNNTMTRFLTEEKYRQVASFKTYPHFNDLVYFSVKGLKGSPKYSILNGDSKNKGTFTTSGKSADIHDIKDVSSPAGSSQKLTLAVGISLPLNVFSGNEIIPSNFEIVSVKDKFKVIKLEPIIRKDGLTHRMVLEAQKVARGERKVEIKLRKQTPQWVTDTNSDDDSRMNKDPGFANKTFGIARLIKGIQSAYTPQDNNEYTFTLTLNLNENN